VDKVTKLHWLYPLPYDHLYVGRAESGCRLSAGEGWICGGRRSDHPRNFLSLLVNGVKLLVDPLVYLIETW